MSPCFLTGWAGGSERRTVLRAGEGCMDEWAAKGIQHSNGSISLSTGGTLRQAGVGTVPT